MKSNLLYAIIRLNFSMPKVFLTFLLLSLIVSLDAQYNIYVSNKGNDLWTGLQEDPVKNDGPLLTLESAVKKVRAHYAEHKGSSYNIILRSGFYTIEKTIEFTPEDDFELVLQAYAGEKPVISAGRKIDGWKKSKVNGHSCWKVNIPEVASGDWYFRQLFVNGERVTRPRFPESGFYEVEDPLLGKYDNGADQLKYAQRDRFIFKEGDIRNWKNLEDVNAMVIHYWQEDYLPVKAVDEEKRQVIFSARSYMAFIRSHPAHACDNAWYYMDNVFEALDKPGEWYLERGSGDLYYIPKPGEKIKDVEIIAPLQNQIIKLTGDPLNEKFVKNIHIEGITFKHNSIQIDRHYGTGNVFGCSGDAMIRLFGAKNCTLTDCEFINLGEYGIEILGASSEIYVVGNSFKDMGAGAIKITSNWTNNWGASSDLMTQNIHFTDNEVHSGGRVFHGAVAVLANFIKHGRILHNHISDFYYNGIVCGGRSSAVGCYDNLIIKNHIHDIGQGWLSDMGGIYVHGLQPGMVLKGNKIHDVNSACYGGNCIYLDDHCEHVIVEQNLLYNANNNVINMKGSENIIRHNILAFGEDAIIRRASPHAVDTMVANIFKNVFIVNNTPVHRTRNEIPLYTPGYFSDINLIWNIGNEPLRVERPFHFKTPSEVGTFEEWMSKTGNDINSVFSNPMLVDPANFDFRPKENSPLKELFINPGTFDDIGPRPKGQRYQRDNKNSTQGNSKIGHVE